MIKREIIKKNNNKAFTLIELLAVIIILGIILLIAIPSVSKYILDSRSKTYIMIAQEHIDGANIMVNSGKYNVFNKEVTYYIPGQCIEMENDSSSSPFADWKDRYVAVHYTGKNYEYYWMSTDEAGMGIKFSKDKDLSVKVLKNGVEEVQPDRLIEGTTEILVMGDDCGKNSWHEAEPDPDPDDPNDPDDPDDPGPYVPPTPDPNNPNIQVNETTWTNGPLTISISIPNNGCYDYGNGKEACNFG